MTQAQLMGHVQWKYSVETVNNEGGTKEAAVPKCSYLKSSSASFICHEVGGTNIFSVEKYNAHVTIPLQHVSTGAQ